MSQASFCHFPAPRRYYSSRQQRINCHADMMFCVTCNVGHAVEVQGRLSVCVSGSFFHEFWLYRSRDDSPQVRSSSHVDFLTAPGSDILGLLQFFKDDYEHCFQAMDVVLVTYLLI